MSNVTFSGPVRLGTNRDANAPTPANVGNVQASQVVIVTATAAQNYDNIIYIPSNSIITSIVFDTITAFTTSGTISIGSTALGGQEYVATVSIAAQGKLPSAPTTQLATWYAPTADAVITSNAGLYIRVAAGGAAGKVGIVVIYRQS